MGSVELPETVRKKAGKSQPWPEKSRWLRAAQALLIGALLAAMCIIHVMIPSDKLSNSSIAFKRNSGSQDELSPIGADESVGRRASAINRISKKHAIHAISGQTGNLAPHSGATTVGTSKAGPKLSQREMQKERQAVERDIEQDELAVDKARKEVQKYDSILSFGPPANNVGLNSLPTSSSSVTAAPSRETIDSRDGEIKAASDEISRYAKDAAAGVDNYVVDTRSEQDNVQGVRQAHSHGHETSDELLKRYSRLAQAGITDSAPSHMPAVGEVITAMSDTGHWRPATVIQCKPNGNVLVHFIGFQQKYDEWLPASKDRIRRQLPSVTARLGSHNEEHIAKKAVEHQVSKPQDAMDEVHKLAARMHHELKDFLPGIHHSVESLHTETAPAAHVSVGTLYEHSASNVHHAARVNQEIQHEHGTKNIDAASPQAHKDAAGLQGVCERCLVDSNVDKGRKEACGICLGDKSMLAVSCGVCMGGTTPESLFSLPFDSAPGANYVLGDNICRDPCWECKRCIDTADEPCWSTCGNCSNCISGALNITGPAISDHNAESLALVGGKKGGCATTCGALAIATGIQIASKLTATHGHRQELARTMQLSEGSVKVSGSGVAMDEIASKLHAASRLAQKLHSTHVQHVIATDEHELARMQAVSRHHAGISPHLLHGMQRAASGLLQGLRTRQSEHAKDHTRRKTPASGHQTQLATGDEVWPTDKKDKLPERMHEPVQTINAQLSPWASQGSWAEISACSLPVLPVLRSPLCSSKEVADGVCQKVWGDLPEIIGPVVGLRVTRLEPTKDDPYGVVLAVRERIRIPGTNTSVDATHGWRHIGVEAAHVDFPSDEEYGEEALAADALGRIETRERGARMSWKYKSQVVANTRRWSIFGFTQAIPDVAVLDCEGQTLGVVRLLSAERAMQPGKGTEIAEVLNKDGLKVVSVYSAGLDLLSDELFRGQHLHVYQVNKEKMRLIASFKRDADYWRVSLEKDSALDPRLASMLVAQIEVLQQPPPAPTLQMYIAKLTPKSWMWMTLLWAFCILALTLLLLGILAAVYGACLRSDCCNNDGCGFFRCLCFPFLCCCPCWDTKNKGGDRDSMSSGLYGRDAHLYQKGLGKHDEEEVRRTSGLEGGFLPAWMHGEQESDARKKFDIVEQHRSSELARTMAFQAKAEAMMRNMNTQTTPRLAHQQAMMGDAHAQTSYRGDQQGSFNNKKSKGAIVGWVGGKSRPDDVQTSSRAGTRSLEPLDGFDQYRSISRIGSGSSRIGDDDVRGTDVPMEQMGHAMAHAFRTQSAASTMSRITDKGYAVGRTQSNATAVSFAENSRAAGTYNTRAMPNADVAVTGKSTATTHAHWRVESDDASDKGIRYVPYGVSGPPSRASSVAQGAHVSGSGANAGQYRMHDAVRMQSSSSVAEQGSASRVQQYHQGSMHAAHPSADKGRAASRTPSAHPGTSQPMSHPSSHTGIESGAARTVGGQYVDQGSDIGGSNRWEPHSASARYGDARAPSSAHSASAAAQRVDHSSGNNRGGHPMGYANVMQGQGGVHGFVGDAGVHGGPYHHSGRGAGVTHAELVRALEQQHLALDEALSRIESRGEANEWPSSNFRAPSGAPSRSYSSHAGQITRIASVDGEFTWPENVLHDPSARSSVTPSVTGDSTDRHSATYLHNLEPKYSFVLPVDPKTPAYP